MKHLFKRVAASLLSVILVASLIPAASADDVLFSIYDADGNLIKTLNTINIVIDAEEGKYVDEDSPVTIVQEKDIVLPSTPTNSYDMLGVWIGPNMTLDMNGHSITLNESNLGGGFAISVGGRNQYGKQAVVKNGSIIINAKSETPEKIFYLGVSAQYYLLLENVSISGGNYGVIMSGDMPIQTIPETIITVSNCVIKYADTPLTLDPLTTQPSIEGTAIVVESGNIENLYSGNAYSGRNVAVDSASTVLNVEAVTGTVITSDATTAMIVKDGNAYLYDTLQDAVNAVDADGTIQLLKQPEDEKIVVPDDPKFSISAFGDDVDTSKLPLETNDGKKVVVGTGGTVEVVDIPATGITLDKTSVEIFKNQTVTLTATVSPANTTDAVTWSSDDGSIATVNENGVVTGVKQGTATITAKAGDVSAKCTVTVDPTWTVTLDGVEHTVIKGQPFTFPSAPTKPGYIFMGWRGVDGVTYQPGDKVAITGDTSFKAIWANMPDITPGTPDEPDDEPDVDVFPFYDVSSGAWYYSAVKYVWEHELMNGVSATEFSPNTTLNRAMIWTMLARLDGVNTDGGANWYAKAQEWAMAEGVSDGTDPMGAVTREQLVTMLWRFKGEPTVDFLLTAKDADTVSSWAYEAMRWAVAEGIIEGDENGLVTPTATATRAQAAAIFMRFIEL